jgi:2'-5' RNA ligase
VTLERLRLFVAVEVPREQRDRVGERVAAWRRPVWGGGWVPAESQHLTLKFLGWTPSERLEEVAGAIAAVAARHAPVTLRVTGVGGFPSLRRARVLWAGVDDPDAKLPALVKDLDEALERLGWAAEARAFTPHLTLARFRSPARLEGALPPEPVPPLEPFEVSRLVLFRSRLQRSGARYEPVLDWPLA